jgi:hypothetical protein
VTNTAESVIEALDIEARHKIHSGMHSLFKLPAVPVPRSSIQKIWNTGGLMVRFALSTRCGPLESLPLTDDSPPWDGTHQRP